MSGFDGLRLDADGYLDMDAYGAGPELSDDEVLDLRDALLADPVEEPTADEWSDLVDGAVEVDIVDAGPFAVDDLPLTDDGADPSVDLADADAAEADPPTLIPTPTPLIPTTTSPTSTRRSRSTTGPSTGATSTSTWSSSTVATTCSPPMPATTPSPRSCPTSKTSSDPIRPDAHRSRPPPMTRDLSLRLVEVCDDALRRLPESPTRDAVLAVRARLLAPLRVAVAGSVSSGKSTLVNALLGQRIAPVDAGECTRLVTWFTYDHHQRIEVQRRDGSITTVPFAAGTRIPEDLGVPADEVARVIVHLSNERLQQLTIIDTPGLNTVTDANQRATAEALGLDDDSREADDSRLAMSDADALLFLTPHVRESDVEVLERFRGLFTSSGLSSANAVGILSKVDRLAPDGDPWPVAHRLAGAARERLSAVVSEVVPVMGLMAETATTDAFTEGDAHALAALAGLDELDLEDALLSPQDLLDADVPGVSRDDLRRLLGMLDLHGIAVGVELVGAGARGATAILRGLRERSGYEPLAELVEQGFARRASALKARGGLADLRRIVARADGADAAHVAEMARPLERIELDPALHDLRILDALRTAEEGAVALPTALVDDLRRLALEETPTGRLGLDPGASTASIATAASAAVEAWARYGNDARRTPAERRLAEDVREWYELVWDQAGGSAPPPAAAPAWPSSPPSAAPAQAAPTAAPAPAAVAPPWGSVQPAPQAQPSPPAPAPAPAPAPQAPPPSGPGTGPIVGAPPPRGPRPAGATPPPPPRPAEPDPAEPPPRPSRRPADDDDETRSTPWGRPR